MCLACVWAGVCPHCAGHTDGGDAGARGVGARHLQQGERQLAAQRRGRLLGRLLIRAALHGPGSQWLQCGPPVPGPAAHSAPGPLFLATHSFSQGAEAGQC